MITWCIFFAGWQLRGIPSLEIAESIAADFFRYGWDGQGHWYWSEHDVEMHAPALSIEIAPCDEFPGVLIVWRVVDVHDRLAIASIIEEHRCPACRRVV